MLADIHWTGKVKPIAFTIFGRDIAWYGILITTAMLIGLIVAIRRAKKIGVTSDDMLELFMFVIPFAIVFARLGYVIFRPDEFFRVENFGWNEFVDVIAVWDGGLTIMTGVPGGILGAFIWTRWRKVDLVHLADAVMPVVLLSQALGRWGNFFNQEIFGRPITNPDFQFFPLAVYIERRGGFFQATFFYEMVLNILFFVALILILRHLRVKGAGLTMYVISYPFVRFIMEFMRDDEGFYKGVNFNQIICIILSVLAAGMFAYLIIRQQKKGEKVWYPKGIPAELYPVAKLKPKEKAQAKSEQNKI